MERGTQPSTTRRTWIRTLGAAGATLSLAGCLSTVEELATDATGGDGNGDDENAGAENGDDGEPMRTDVEEISRHASDLPDSPDYAVYADGSFEDEVDRESGEPMTVEVHTTFEEVDAEVVPGTSMQYWTFDGSLPGPLIRVREGDTVQWTLENPPENGHAHNIAIHAASGPGGGGAYTDVLPDGTAELDTTLLDAGVYVYHCAFPPIGEHIGRGMNGVIVVEPEDGLPPVDHEFYVVQGDFYTEAGGARAATQLEDEGHLSFSREALYREEPTFVAFNGRPGALEGNRALGAVANEIEPGDDVRLFFGNGGPALLSSYRGAVGSRMDHYGGGFTPIEENEETVVVPAGAAKMFEMQFETPGVYPMYDHSFPRPDKGAKAEWLVQGDLDEYDEIFDPKRYDEVR